MHDVHISHDRKSRCESVSSMRRNLAAIAGTLAIMLGCVFALRGTNAAQSGGQARSSAVLRVGTYDSRAVAVAYVRSDLSARNL